MGKIFSYFGLASSVLASVSMFQAALHQSTVSGASLAAAVDPVLSSLPSVLPHVMIPHDLVLRIADAAAEVINDYFKPKAAVAGA